MSRKVAINSRSPPNPSVANHERILLSERRVGYPLRYLVTVPSNVGNLYRVDTGSREVTQIDLGGEALTDGDGILLDVQTLYVVLGRDGVIVPVELSEDFASGEVGEAFSDPSFARPTTIAKYGDHLLVVNSQFNRRESGESPELPFTVSAIEVP